MVVPKPTPCPSPVSPSQTLKVSLFGATGLRGRPLWSGQYEKVANQDFYLAEFAPDAGGAVKYTFEDRIMFHGETCLIYKHIHGRHPKVAVLIHDHQPVVAIDRELVWREDGQVVAIVYSYATTGETITVKTYFCSVAFMHLRLFIFQHGISCSDMLAYTESNMHNMARCDSLCIP